MTIQNKSAPVAANDGGAGKSTGWRVSTGEHSALRRLRALLPGIALETRIALDVARDLWVTGGCDEADGRRLHTAYQRLQQAVEAVAAAEAEVLR